MAAGELVLPFAFFAGIIFAGVLAHRVFERTSIPDVLLLMALGIVLASGLGVDPSPLALVAPAIGSFALLIILLEGGLELNFRHVVQKARATTLLTFVSLAVTALAVAVVADFLGLPFWPLGILLGLAVGPLSASVLLPMLSRLPIKPETRAILSLECTLGEAVAVIAVFAVSEAALLGHLDVASVVGELTTTFTLGVGIAAVGGFVWLELLRFLGRTPYSYMVTLAAAEGLFAVVQFLGGNGFVGVLVFGLVLGNAKAISAHLPPSLRTTVELDDAVRWMNTEVTFFVRTFYFVYLGLILSLAAFTAGSMLLAALVLAAVLVARFGSVHLLVRLRPAEREDQDALRVLVPRGLATAILAAVPLNLGLAGAAQLVEISSVVIVLSNVAMTVGLVALRRRGPASIPGAGEPGPPPREEGAPAGDAGM